MKRQSFSFSALCATFVLFLGTACPLDSVGTLFYTPAEVKSADAVAADGEVAVTWTVSGDTSYTSFRITKEDASGTSETISVDGEGYLFTGLTNGTEYTFTVSSVYNGSVYSEKTAYATPQAGNATNTGYVAGYNDAIHLEDNVSVLEIGNVKGKLISYASINAGDAVITPENKRRLAYAKNGTTGSGSSAQIISQGVSFSDNARAAAQNTGIQIKHFVPPKDGTLSEAGGSARATTTGQNTDTFSKTSPAVGQTLTLWRDSNAKMSTYKQTQMTLRAIGYEGGYTSGSTSNIVCLVWVADANYNATAYGGTTVNNAICQNIAKTFAKYYTDEEGIFGKTSNKLITYKAANELESMAELKQYQNNTDYLENMSNKGKTGEYINIVIYDIGNDYSSSSSGGVVGYFYSKDYFVQDSRYSSSNAPYYSNAGKFFYLDAPFCNYRAENKDFVGTGDVSLTAISTLFHEYQHMIAFGQKDMRGVDTTDAKESYMENHCFNEMMSMLAEDLMTDPLKLYGTEDYVASARLTAFNKYYWMSGALEYLNNDYSVISYSTAYALGAYVARNYGGAEFIQKMGLNDYYGKDCIIEGIKDMGMSSLLSGTEITFENLLAEYVSACVFRTKYANDHSKPTHNVTSQSNGSDMNLHAINLFSADYGYQTSSSSPMRYGPLYLNALSAQDIDLEPTGFHIYSIGQAESDTITLYFTKKSAGDTVYIYIQDYFEQTVVDTTSVADSSASIRLVR